jgi:hypothetical protein
MTEQQEVNNFQSNHPNQTKAYYFNKQDILDALNQDPSVDGIRIWQGQDGTKFTAWMHGAVSKKDFDLVQAKSVKGLPCPDWCQ